MQNASHVSVYGPSIAEEFIPLFTATNSNSVSSSSGSNVYVNRGSKSASATLSSQSTLHKLSSNWPATQKFALEGVMYPGNNSTPMQAVLYDVTAGAQVAGSSIQVTTTVPGTVRSGSFTLTPGHSYAVLLISTGGGTGYWARFSLVALMQ